MARRFLIVLGLVATVLVVATLWRVDWQRLKKLPLPPGGDFVLQSADGPVNSRDLRGKILLLYFGYTHCPDVCPTSLAAVGQALTALSPEERPRVQAFMVSLDPERDTPALLKEYTSYFQPGIRGLVGTPAETAVLARAYGVSYFRQKEKGNGDYAVDHTTSTYMVNQEGKLAAVLPLGTSAESILAVIRKEF